MLIDMSTAPETRKHLPQASQAHIAPQDRKSARVYMASLSDRFFAALIDHVIVLVLFLITNYFLNLKATTAGFSFGITLYLLISWSYSAGFESGRKQATPGKRLCGICVITTDLERVSFNRASLRYLCKLLSMATGTLGFFAALVHPERKSLHDWLAGTLVVWA